MKIKANTIISARSIGDSNCTFEIMIIKRTEKTATIIDTFGEKKRSKIHTDSNGEEFIKPENYSFAPVFKASKSFEFVEGTIS